MTMYGEEMKGDDAPPLMMDSLGDDGTAQG